MITAFLMVATFMTTFAQRIAYVDVNEILETIEEYRTAQADLDKLAATWQQDIQKEYDKVRGMYNRYQAEQVLLSDEERTEREDEIMNKEKEIRETQRTKFGAEGELFQRRKELVQPIQDRVYAAIEQYANDKGFDFIFDRGSTTGMLFASDSFDKTQDVLRLIDDNK